MLIAVAEHLTRYYTGFNVFSYLTMRAILSALTALVLSFAMGPALIQKLALQKIGQQIREVGPESHLPKAGTPTMGGALGEPPQSLRLDRALGHALLRRDRLRR